MAESVFKKWEEKIEGLQTDDFKKGVLSAIRKLKQEIYDLKVDHYNQQQGRVIHDDRRIILSAPEIIIGDVNLGGILNGNGGSKVTIRSNDVELQGVGDTGKIDMRAPIIAQTGENAGVDGNEHVVGDVSQVSAHAGNITLQSDVVEKDGALPSLDPIAESGIRLKSDHTMELLSTTSKTYRQKRLDDTLKDLEASKEICDAEVGKLKGEYKTIREEVDELLKKKQKLGNDERSIRTDYTDMEELNDSITDLSMALTTIIYRYSNALSRQTETTRLMAYFKKQKDELSKIDDEKFKKISTNTSLALVSEKINITTGDDDGNVRTNKEAGVNVLANTMSIAGPLDDKGAHPADNRLDINMQTVEISTAGMADYESDDKDLVVKAQYQAQGDVIVKSKNITLETVDYEVVEKKYKEKGLTADSKIKLRSKTVEVSTVNSSDVEVDEQGKLTKAKYKAEGDVIINSKTFALKATDSELNGSDTKETALTAGSTFALRTEKMDLSATDTEGKATGSIAVNAKDIAVKAMDVEKENHADSKLAEGGVMTLVSEKMTIGAKSKEMKSKSVTALSEEIKLQADKLFDAQQGEAKAEVKLTDSKGTISADKAEITCQTTIDADTEVKGTVKAPKGEFNNLKAKSSFNSPNISDGMGV